jgi:hypothetical protein
MKKAFLITTDKFSYCFFATSEEEKESWLKDIRDQKKDGIKKATSNMKEYRKSVRLNAEIVQQNNPLNRPVSSSVPPKLQTSSSIMISNSNQTSSSNNSSPNLNNLRDSKNTMFDEYEQLMNDLEGSRASQPVSHPNSDFIDQIENILK